MSSKLPSQIKAGDRLRCVAVPSELAGWGISANARKFAFSTVTVVDVDPPVAPDLKVVFDVDKSAGSYILPMAAFAPMEPPSLEETEEAVIRQIRSRRDAGRAKYGTTMERTDLSVLQWVQHAQEEAMDFAIYLEKLKRVLKEKGIE